MSSRETDREFTFDWGICEGKYRRRVFLLFLILKAGEKAVQFVQKVKREREHVPEETRGHEDG